MFNYKKYLAILSFLIAIYGLGQSNWSHVGPKSNDNPTQLPNSTPNKFETSQFNRIIIDPNNDSHLFAGGMFAGLWESWNRGTTWTNVSTNPNGANGLLGLAFFSSTQIIVSNYIPGYNVGVGSMDYSNKISTYDFQTQTWQSLSPLPTGGQSYVIKNVDIYPNNPSTIFACTSIGLFRSDDGGQNWDWPLQNCYAESIVFLPDAQGAYSIYVAGSNQVAGYYKMPMGVGMVQQSTDGGQTFTDLSSYLTPTPTTCSPLPRKSHSMLCVGPNGPNANDKSIFVLTVVNAGTSQGWDPSGWDVDWKDTYGYYCNTWMYLPGGKFLIDKLEINQFTFSVNATHYTSLLGLTNGFGNTMGSTRMALGYDPVNNRVWFGSQRLSYLDLDLPLSWASNLKTDVHSGALGSIHMDHHCIQIQPYSGNGQYEMYVACDGGIVRTPLDPASPNGIPYFEELNYGLDVALVNGFSGSQQDPDLYAVGGQDIVHADIYDAGIQGNLYTHAIGNENDGPLIDKFNDQIMIFDQSSYTTKYRVSTTKGSSFDGADDFYNPAPGNTFAKGQIEGDQNALIFTSRHFYQDPYRPNRIFHGKGRTYGFSSSNNHGIGISQFDYSSKTFVNKIIPLKLDPSPTWNSYPTPSTGSWFNALASIAGMSFSPQTKNSFHFLVSGTDWPAASPPAIIKYIGNDIDDVWVGHNDAYNPSNPQWANIVPDFTNLSSMTNCTTCQNLSTNDLNTVQFKEIETSPWDKDRIYVLVYIPNNPGKMVLKYDGTNWSNYSDGLPSTDFPVSMIMDHASNDALYISTQNGVYYRDASMNNWVPYNTGLPLMFGRQMEVNYNENTVRVGLYGRGIWKSDLMCPSVSGQNLNTAFNAGYYESDNLTASAGITAQIKPTALRGTNSVMLNPGFIASGTTTNNTYCLAYIHGCSNAGTSSTEYWRTSSEPQRATEETEFETQEIFVYPNPNNGSFIISRRLFEGSVLHDADISIYDIMGKEVLKKENSMEPFLEIKLNNHPPGVYLIKAVIDGKISTIRVVKQ